MDEEVEGLSTEAHRILRLYEMFFSLMFRFLEEYKVKDLGTVMIITTVAIAKANRIQPDIDMIAEETEIPYSTVRRKIEKLCDHGILKSERRGNKAFYSIAENTEFAHPEQSVHSVNALFQRDVMDIVIKSVTSIILEKKK